MDQNNNIVPLNDIITDIAVRLRGKKKVQNLQEVW